MKNFISIMFLQNIKNIEGEENVEIVDFSTVKIRTCSGGFRFVSVNADGLVTSDQDEEVRTEYTYDDHNKKTMIKKICNDGSWRVIYLDQNGLPIRVESSDGTGWDDTNVAS